MAEINFKIKQGVTYEDLYEKLDELELLNSDEMYADDKMHIDLSTVVDTYMISEKLYNKIHQDFYGDLTDEELDESEIDLRIRLHETFTLDIKNGTGTYVDGMFQVYEMSSLDDNWYEEDSDFESGLFKEVKEKLSRLQDMIEIV